MFIAVLMSLARVYKSCHDFFSDHERSFEWTLYSYLNETKLIQFWNVINLDVNIKAVTGALLKKIIQFPYKQPLQPQLSLTIQ